MTFPAGIALFMSEMSVGDRVAPISLPQGAETPFLVYKVISSTPDLTHDSAQDSPSFDGVRYTVDRVQFDCYGATYDEAVALADELLDHAAGYKGLWGDVEVDRVDPAIRVDDWDEGPGLYRVIQDLFVGHRSVPGS